MASNESKVEVVEDNPEEVTLVRQPSAGELTTYGTDYGPLKIRLIPQITDTGAEWTLWLLSENVQGPLLQTSDPITRDEAEAAGIPDDLRERLNDTLRYAREELNLASELGTDPEDTAPLNVLEAQMEGER